MPKLFISYRREDSESATGRISDQLQQQLGKDNIFQDVHHIKIGSNFRKALGDALSQCDAMLVIIGRSWLSLSDTSGLRRLDAPNDYVRLEVETALSRDIPVVPILVEGAHLPLATELPESIKPLVDRQKMEIRSDEHFRADLGLLLERLAQVITIEQREQGRQGVTGYEVNSRLLVWIEFAIASFAMCAAAYSGERQVAVLNEPYNGAEIPFTILATVFFIAGLACIAFMVFVWARFTRRAHSAE